MHGKNKVFSQYSVLEMQHLNSRMGPQNVCCPGINLMPCGRETYVCTNCHIQHACGDACNAKIQTTEGIVCSLTGQFLETVTVHAQPFTINGRSQSHFVVRPVHRKRRLGSVIDPTDTKAQKLVHAAIEEIMKSTKRKNIQQNTRTRFIKEAIRVAKKSNRNFFKISRGIRSVTDQYIMSLLPTVDSDQVIGNLSKCSLPLYLQNTRPSHPPKANRFTLFWCAQKWNLPMPN